MKIKFILLALALLAIQACDDGVSLPEWDYNDNKTIGEESESNVPVDSVYFEITSHAHLTTDELVDSMLVFYPQFANYKQTVLAVMKSTAAAEIEFDSYSFLYNSKDEKGKDVKLSALLLVPDKFPDKNPHRLIVDNRPTQTCNDLVPSKAFNFTEIFACMGHPVVAPDLIGYGASSDRTMSFCCQHTSSRNTVDAILAAQAMLSSQQLGFRINNYLPVYNIGYSLGGYNALALLRYMETEATEKEMNAIDIKRTYCGAGPYVPLTFETTVLSHDTYMYSPFMMMCIQSILAYHSDVMKGAALADFVTDKVIESGLPEQLQSGNYTSEQLVQMTFKAIGNFNVTSFFSPELVNPFSAISASLGLGAQAENLITEDWMPKGEIKFWAASNDDVVPVECTQFAEQLYGSLPNVSFQYSDDVVALDNSGVHQNAAISFFYSIISDATVWE